MPTFPPNHAERYAMADEVHARPPQTVASPALALLAFLAVRRARRRAAEREQVN